MSLLEEEGDQELEEAGREERIKGQKKIALSTCTNSPDKCNNEVLHTYTNKK